MIFYFSGTGNSHWIANELGKAFDEKQISLSDELHIEKNHFTYHLDPNEKIFFVFPVHSWGPAVEVLRFIKKINLTGYINQKIYLVCSCGDNCGYTNRIIKKALHKRGFSFTKGYSIQMPNNYILMKGFHTDTKELEQEKLQKAPLLVNNIIENIRTGEETEIYTVGKFSFLKSYIVYPAFRKFILGKNSFYANENCISCNKCVEVCPTKTITLVDEKPVWDNTCVQCSACIHYCPEKAIEWGKVSVNKGRYHHPDMR